MLSVPDIMSVITYERNGTDRYRMRTNRVSRMRLLVSKPLGEILDIRREDILGKYSSSRVASPKTIFIQAYLFFST
jgi:hypothetical protein